jgi:hypothetical protein
VEENAGAGGASDNGNGSTAAVVTANGSV